MQRIHANRTIKHSIAAAFWLCLLMVANHSVADDVGESKNAEGQAATETGELRMTFRFQGKPPKPEPLELPASCGSLKMTDETMIINGNNRGIMNIVVYAIGGQPDLPGAPPRKKNLTLACWNCRFVPRIVLAQSGDTLKVRNMDKIGYNANFSFFRNDEVNVAVPPGREHKIELGEPEPAVIPFATSIFPWMVGSILLVDHSFCGVSDPDGLVQISDLPVGKKIVFRAWHERATFQEKITINGEQSQWPANKFDVEIKAGLNDLGVIEIGLDQFTK